MTEPSRYFADENAIGLAKILIRDHHRLDVIYSAIEEIPRGTPDLTWMPIVGERGWIILTRDRRIRTRPAEQLAYWEHGLRSVWIGGKQDHTSMELAEIFLQHEERLRRLTIKLGGGPWALTMSRSGIRPLRLRQPKS
ncbi:hypothetical protein [Kribbella sp. CA-294648]|uniref:PIN-like domain-containing protein n=1 Tax=Kribbella sp. CA-294648 TaxID=3239948 RepID=UPI003D8F1A6F